MIKKTVKYVDYNGNERTEDLYFNLSQAEVAEMELSVQGGLSNRIKKVVDSQEIPEILKMFKEFILLSYGVKSDDGRQFIKSEEQSKNFSQTEAYNVLFMELASDDKKAIAFLEGILPNAPQDNKKKLPNQ